MCLSLPGMTWHVIEFKPAGPGFRVPSDGPCTCPSCIPTTCRSYFGGLFQPFGACFHGISLAEQPPKRPYRCRRWWQDKARYVHLMREGTFGKTASKGASPKESLPKVTSSVSGGGVVRVFVDIEYVYKL